MSTDATTYRKSIHFTVSAGRTAGSSLCLSKAEEMLVSKLRSGEEEAFEAVVAQQHASLIRIAMGYVANREVAEEVVQETWMAVMNGLNRFEGRSSLRTWIRAILIHKAKDRGVLEKRHTAFSDFELNDDDHNDAIDPSYFKPSREWAGHWAFSPQPWDDRTPEKLLLSKHAIACMQRTIDALPATLKDVLTLCDADKVKTTEVCKRLNITKNNLYVRLHRARERVRAAVET